MRGVKPRDVMLTKMVWERTQQTSHFKTASNTFQSKTRKGVETLFPRVPAPLHICLNLIQYVLYRLVGQSILQLRFSNTYPETPCTETSPNGF